MFGSLVNLLTKLIPSLLPKLLTERPDLIVDHALAYAALAKSEFDVARAQLIKRVLAASIALASALSFVVLAGMALMLYASSAQITESMWVLIAVPGVMLLVTAIAAAVALSKGKSGQSALGMQVRLDVQAFRAVMESRA